MILDEKRERHWRMVFKKKYGGVNNEKAILHANWWGVYMEETNF